MRGSKQLPLSINSHSHDSGLSTSHVSLGCQRVVKFLSNLRNKVPTGVLTFLDAGGKGPCTSILSVPQQDADTCGIVAPLSRVV